MTEPIPTTVYSFCVRYRPLFQTWPLFKISNTRLLLDTWLFLVFFFFFCC